MPVRHRKRSATSYLGWVHVPIAGRPIWHESSLERDFLQWMAFIPSLVRIEEQPVRICDRGRTYTPDFNLELRIQPSRFYGTEFTHLLEIKPFRVLQEDWDELEPRIELGADYARAHGWNFKVLTELEIRPAEFPLIQFLRRFLWVGPHLDLTQFLLDLLAYQPRTLLELLECTKKNLGLEPRQVLPTIWHLVATRKIGLADPPSFGYQALLSHAEDPELRVWIPGQRLSRILLETWEVRPIASCEKPMHTSPSEP